MVSARTDVDPEDTSRTKFSGPGLALECVILGHIPGINAGNEWTVRVGLNGSVSV